MPMQDKTNSDGDANQRCLEFSRTMRQWIIEQSLRSNVGHIGSALSIVEIMVVLWGEVMRNPGTTLPDRDRFILSKGHAALALYAALRWKGLLSEQTFRTYAGDNSSLGVHPETSLPGVDVCTGSLGQGLSIGCGLAYGQRELHPQSRTFVVLSDAECNEGQVWEAAMFASHHRLSNLCVIVDLNGLQAMGFTKNILDLKGQQGIWAAMGWDAIIVDGHNSASLQNALSPTNDRPKVVIAETILGKGVSFMENKLEWHYRNLDRTLAEQATKELATIK